MLIGFGNGLNRRESEEETCRSPMLVLLEWVSVLADRAIRTQKWQVGMGESVWVSAIISLALKEKKKREKEKEN